MTHDRRDALRWGGGLVAAAALAVRGPAAAPWPLGVQLYSVDADLARDFEGTLTALAGLGFRAVELAGLHGRTPAAFAAGLGKAGLRPVGAHYPMSALLADPARAVGEARDVGARWLVAASPAPAVPPAPGTDWITGMGQAMTPADWARDAAALDGLGARARAAGLRFAFHNHPFEFMGRPGHRGIDRLLAGSDPALVAWELDVAWAVAGGADPVALLRAHRGRIRLLHAKGLRAAPPPGRYGTDFTTGIVGRDDVVPWGAVLAAARGTVEQLFIEQEPPHRVPVMAALAACRDALARLG